MASAVTGVSLSTIPRIWARVSDSSNTQFTGFPRLNQPWQKRSGSYWTGRILIRPMASSPDLSEKVAESIKEAQEKCGEDPVSGECVAAWDEVEELAAAVSHEKAKKKGADPLEEFCKDNMETDECRTYED